jgi:ABC-type uncharacterized transport system substrate-binding protein
MRRRDFITLAGAGALAKPKWAWAQSTERGYRVGWFGTTADSFSERYGQEFVRRLGELGFNEGKSLKIERRYGTGDLKTLPALAAELAELKCDVFFGGGPEANLAALTQASRDTPIVFVAVDFDPVATGDVASLARPGGRVTGVTALQSELPAKRLELLKELLPGVSRVAVFTNEETTGQLAPVLGTARRLGLALHVIDFKRPPFDYEAGMVEAARERAEALYVLSSGLFVPARNLIPALALKAKLPTVFTQFQWAEAGGLMSYGFDFSWMWRRGADLVAKVLRGAKPGDLPMEQPTTYELAINTQTAKTLGIKVPDALMLRADRVIE